jgi:LPS O-antigen subunit length determinant protein (WzzB/FepE family)
MRTRRRYRKKDISAIFFLSAGLACAFVSPPAYSLTGIVHDPIQTAKHLAEFKEQVARWKATAAHYQQQLISLRGMNFRKTAMSERFSEVTQDYGMEEACRKKGEGVLGAITSLFKPDADAEILEQQLQICRRTVQAENLKYNETVRFLNALRDRQNELAEIDIARDNVGTEQGKMHSVIYDIESYEKNSKMDYDRWNAMIIAYDDYIESLNKYQRRLAERALNGKQPDVFSAVIQGGVLKETLNSMRDPD